MLLAHLILFLEGLVATCSLHTETPDCAPRDRDEAGYGDGYGDGQAQLQAGLAPWPAQL